MNIDFDIERAEIAELYATMRAAEEFIKKCKDHIKNTIPEQGVDIGEGKRLVSREVWTRKLTITKKTRPVILAIVGQKRFNEIAKVSLGDLEKASPESLPHLAEAGFITEAVTQRLTELKAEDSRVAQPPNIEKATRELSAIDLPF